MAAERLKARDNAARAERVKCFLILKGLVEWECDIGCCEFKQKN